AAITATAWIPRTERHPRSGSSSRTQNRRIGTTTRPIGRDGPRITIICTSCSRTAITPTPIQCGSLRFSPATGSSSTRATGRSWLAHPKRRTDVALTLSSSRAFSLRACGAHLSQCPQFPREAFRDVSGICERTTRRAAGISLGAWAYYDHPYYGDPCIIWTGYALERRRLSTRAELGSTLPLVGRVGAKRRGGGRAVIR